MTPCPVCGQQNKPDLLEQPAFILSLCKDCGFASGIAPNIPSDSQKNDRIQEPPTGEVHLSPTAAYSVSELIEHSPSLDGMGPQTTLSAIVHLVSADPQLGIEPLNQLKAETNIQLRRHALGPALLTHLIDDFDRPEPTIIVVESNFESFPALELGFATRAIETAFAAKRAPIIFVGDDNESVLSGHRQLGETHIVMHSHRDGGDALIKQIRTFL
jgi:hypothetical protein